MEGLSWSSACNAAGIYGSFDYLIDCCGELLLVHEMKVGVLILETHGFLVFRFDFSRNAWVELEDIGTSTTFLSERRGMACVAAELGVKQNSIYSTDLYFDRYLRAFDLEDHSFSLALPCPTMHCYAEFDIGL